MYTLYSLINALGALTFAVSCSIPIEDIIFFFSSYILLIQSMCNAEHCAPGYVQFAAHYTIFGCNRSCNSLGRCLVGNASPIALMCVHWSHGIIFGRCRVFSWGGLGVPPSGENFANPPPPSNTCPRFWTKACPPPAEVRPRKFEKFKYIFVLNLTTFQLKSTLKSCISCLKWPNFALSGQFWLQSDFFHKSPPHPTTSPSGTENFESPHQKFREKTLRCTVCCNETA